jgi:hypothetical protein
VWEWRLYPTAYITRREAIRDTTVTGALMYTTYRDPRFFPDPDAFRPDRPRAEVVHRRLVLDDGDHAAPRDDRPPLALRNGARRDWDAPVDHAPPGGSDAGHMRAVTWPHDPSEADRRHVPGFHAVSDIAMGLTEDALR